MKLKQYHIYEIWMDFYILSISKLLHFLGTGYNMVCAINTKEKVTQIEVALQDKIYS